MARDSKTSDGKEVKSSILELSAEDFISYYLFDRIPYIFGEDRDAYISWKNKLAKELDVDPACIIFVGSSAVGISLSPYRALEPFNSDSDVDVGIISQYHFDVAWRFFRKNKHRRTSLYGKTLTAWNDQPEYIYWGTIITDRLLGILPFGKHWQSALNLMARIPPTEGRNIKLRIYSDYDSLRDYQAFSLSKVREKMMFKGEADA